MEGNIPSNHESIRECGVTMKTYPGILEGWVICPDAGSYVVKVHVTGQRDGQLVAQSGRTQLAVVGAIMTAPHLEEQYPVGRGAVCFRAQLL